RPCLLVVVVVFFFLFFFECFYLKKKPLDSTFSNAGKKPNTGCSQTPAGQRMARQRGSGSRRVGSWK
ncbi:hypothetical protein ABE587_19620, partial [[Pseudomonas] hibiscicola]